MVSRSTPSTCAEMTFTPLIVRAWATRSSSFDRAPLRFSGVKLLFELPLGLLRALDGCGQVLFVHAQAGGNFRQDLPRALVVGECGRAGDGLDAADARGGGLLHGNFEDTDVAGAAHVRASAKFLAVKAARRGGIGNGDDANVLLGIAVAEKGQRAGSERVVNRRDIRLDLGVEQNFVVHLLLDVAQFGGIDRGEVRKIETQARRLDERSGLLHVRAQNVAQRGVHQVRRRCDCA